MLIFHIGSLFGKPQGAKVRHSLNGNFELPAEDSIVLEGPLKGDAEFLKLPHEVNVQIHNLEVCAKSVCNRCLKHFSLRIHVPLASREFIINVPDSDLEPGEELCRVLPGRNEIDLAPVIREEILLHFPPVPVCSESCKGLCDQCGANRNKKPCDCKQKSEFRNSPFRIINP